jgi:DNA-binding GntR family transcriptional regulator
MNIVTTPITLADLTQVTYTRLREGILTRQFGPGSKLRVTVIAEALGVSRTPVTLALRRLASEGLVELIPRRHAIVAKLTEGRAEEVFELRLLLELHAADSIIANGGVHTFLGQVQMHLDLMQRAVEDPACVDYAAFIPADAQFHATLVQQCRNSRMSTVYEDLAVHIQIAQAHYAASVDTARQAQVEHLAVIEAFKEGNATHAKALLRDHIQNAREHTIELIRGSGGFV